MNRQHSPGDQPPMEFKEAVNGGGSGSTNSVSRTPDAPQPTEPAASPPCNNSDELPASAHDNLSVPSSEAKSPIAHVVLYQPEIPQNTGNIGRTCVAVGAKLWIVRPASFRIDDARLRRAGLDYWQHLQLGDAPNWEALVEQLAPRRMFFLSRFAKRTIWDVTFQREDVFVFGSETSGLPPSILDPLDEHALRLPTSPLVRSLNLATTVGIVLFEQQRQLNWEQGQ